MAIIVLLCLWPEFRYKCEPFFLLVYIHAAYWCISWVGLKHFVLLNCYERKIFCFKFDIFFQILHQHLKLKHRMLRVNGYLEFYKQTEAHIRIPFYIISLCKYKENLKADILPQNCYAGQIV